MSTMERYQLESTGTESGSLTRWLMATNQRNMLYMLASGLVMPPKAFGGKYYQDTLSYFPGWIPLFANSVPEVCISHSVSERNHLMPCLASIDLSSLKGTVKAVGTDGSVRDISFPEEINVGVQAILVPAPLPITWIQSIIFESKDARTACDTDALDFGNVPIKEFKREITPKLFTNSSQGAWPPEGIELSNIDGALKESQVFGCMMVMLFHYANKGDLGSRTSQFAFDPDDVSDKQISDPILLVMKEWGKFGCSPSTNDVSQMLFWGAVDKLVAWQTQGYSGSSLDTILEYLDEVAEKLDDRMKQALIKLGKDLRMVAGFSDSTVTELFERHPKSFSRVMTLFFLRERCSDLLEFQHLLLNEIDYLTAAILFSAREGWLNLSLELRAYPGISEAVPHRMAALAHRMTHSGIDLGVPPQRPRSIRELFQPGVRGWSKAQQEAAAALAKDCKWSCLQTRVTLGKGGYRLEVDGKGMHILIDGEVKAVQSEVDQSIFLEKLAQGQLTSKQQTKVLKMLKMVG